MGIIERRNERVCSGRAGRALAVFHNKNSGITTDGPAVISFARTSKLGDFHQK
jgi:hypothetical protein